MSEVERIKALFGCSLEDVHEIVSVPYAQADLHERTFKVRVFEILMRTGLQLLERREREEFRSAVLGQVASLLGEPRAKAATILEAADTCARPETAPQVETEPAVPHKDG